MVFEIYEDAQTIDTNLFSCCAYSKFASWLEPLAEYEEDLDSEEDPDED
jgi:hypothetical protein